ncbi:hypothetical protein Zmor_008932 [Zophobas morio]|uniref:long-chain-fatty-acid--CoA ligase n=1 Tax=Zophobas morio TaxID=2755281 RepID=A0AA38M003_9CUCU|nr:hypothetical protein Zmor_008932 [Zophobas morio]
MPLYIFEETEKLTLSEYKWLTYGQVYAKVINFAKGLLETYDLVGKKIAIFMDTCKEWQIAAYSCYATRIGVVTFYANLGEEAIGYGLQQTSVSHLVTEGRLVPTIKKIASKCPKLKHIIYTTHLSDPLDLEDITLLQFEEIEKMGEKSSKVLCPPEPGDLAVLMYTSGSTGQPKGVKISHRQAASATYGFLYYVLIVSFFADGARFVPEDVYIAYLPLAHILELVAEMALLSVGASLGFGSPSTLSCSSPRIKSGTKGDLVALRPTLMAAVPAIMDRIRKGVMDRLAGSSFLVRYLFQWAYNARKAARKRGKDTPFWNAVIFKKISALLGGRMRLCLSGGAPLSQKTQEFINVVFGIPVLQGYGLTETTGVVSLSHPRDKSYGRVGCPVATMEIKLVDWEEGGYFVSDSERGTIGLPRGEICIAGENLCAGYFADDEKTNEDFVADPTGKLWFHSGDIGQLHPDGCLEIIDRKKDLVKLQMGEYVSLGRVESVLKCSKYVDNICLCANPYKKFTVAVICPVRLKIELFATNKSIEYGTLEELYANKEVIAEVLQSLQEEAKKAQLKRFETPSRIHLTTDLWTPETELVTTALKIKRKELNSHYRKEIENMYR